VTLDEKYVGIVMADVDWKMPQGDKKTIKEALPKKEIAKTKELVKK
jgi:hypothetical protein